MRAAYFQSFGGPEQVTVGERPALEPKPGEMLVRVRGAGVGYWDVKAVAGLFGHPPLPRIPGNEIAGVVEQSPPDCPFQPGDEIFASVAGGWAEYAAARPGRAGRKPGGIGFEESAGLVIAGATAFEGLVDRSAVAVGDTVLVAGASGGVGTAAVQIARSLDAHVFALAGRRHHDLLRELGAEHCFDYTDPTWPDQLRSAAPGGVDILFDAAGGDVLAPAIGVTRDGGQALLIAGAPDELPRGITGGFFSAVATGDRLASIARLVESGRLRPVQDTTFALEQASEALALVAGRHSRGKVSLSI